MRRNALALASILGALLFVGCNHDNPKAAPAETAVQSAPTPQPSPSAKPSAPSTNTAARSSDEPVYHLDHAQPKLATTKLWLGPKEMDAEVAHTRTQIATGLMFRPGIGPNDGMLFIFARPYQPAFYMKNVDFEIAAAYIDPDGVVQEIVKLKARDESPVPSTSSNIQFVLETAPDWWERNGLGVGTLIRTDKLSLRENFLGR